MEVCHVKNTGRCRELLLPGVRVVLAVAQNPARKTKYDLIAVYKGDTLINMDSQAPNQVAAELLPRLFPDAERIKAECTRGDSRLDFCMERQGRKTWVEVKGVTLEEKGIALFPDAPTQRGVKHIHTLISCAKQGDQACLLFLIQMKGPFVLRPNLATHPAFGQALCMAREKGVQLLAYDCLVAPGEIYADAPVRVDLPESC